jgi:hypothetical protein
LKCKTGIAQYSSITSGSFKVETRDETTVLWMLIDLVRLFGYWNKIELKFINWGSAGLSAESLKERGSEAGWVSEGSDPEDEWNSLLSPDSQEFISLSQVLEPVCKWLQ